MYLSLATLWTLPVLYFFLPESLSWLITNKKLERADTVKKTLLGTHQQPQGETKDQGFGCGSKVILLLYFS